MRACVCIYIYICMYVAMYITCLYALYTDNIAFVYVSIVHLQQILLINHSLNTASHIMMDSQQ